MCPVPHRFFQGQWPDDEIFLPIMSDSVDKLDAEWRREENRKLMNALLTHNRMSVVFSK